MFDAKGILIACEGSDGGGRCVARWDVKTGRARGRSPTATWASGSTPATTSASTRRGGSTSPTRATWAPSPASWSTAPSTGSTPTATVVEVTHDVEKPNGIAISPDQKTLYVADHNNGTDRIDPDAPQPKLGRDEGLRLPPRPRRARRTARGARSSTSATRRGATG